MLLTPLYFIAAMLAGLARSVPMPAPMLENRSTYPCVEGALILVARGSDHEWTHPTQLNPDYVHIGGMGLIGEAIAETVGKGSYVRALPYPAVNKAYDYGTSVELGVASAQGTIRNYIETCKPHVHPKIVLMGWSQGANVMSNAIAGSRQHPALPASYYKYIKAVATFGDPTYVPNIPLDRGGATHSGKVPRSEEGVSFLMENYRHQIKFFCLPGDAACDSGTAANANEIHQSEVKTLGPHAQKWILRHLQK